MDEVKINIIKNIAEITGRDYEDVYQIIHDYEKSIKPALSEGYEGGYYDQIILPKFGTFSKRKDRWRSLKENK